MSAPSEPPTYKGEPLDAGRGPGLGCFWIQIALLTSFLVLTPLTVMWAWDPFISGALLILTLVLLLFAGQTVIFLLRLVAADRRTRRRPLDPGARRTVGQMEDDAKDGRAQVTAPSAEGTAPSAEGTAPPVEMRQDTAPPVESRQDTGSPVASKHARTPHAESMQGGDEMREGETPEGETPEGETPEGETPRGEAPRDETPQQGGR